MNKNSNSSTPATKEKTRENHVGYIGARVSQKQMKMMLRNMTPEARKVFKSAFCPNMKGGVYSTEQRKFVRGTYETSLWKSRKQKAEK